MSFIWPSMLYFLALVPVFVAAYMLILRRKRSAAVTLGSTMVARAAAARTRSFRRHIPPLLLLMSLTLLIFGLSRPMMELVLPSQRGTVILALDISGSMLATDIEPSRIEASREAARAFVDEQPANVRIGVVVFAGSSAVAQQPTLDRGEVFAAIDRFQTQLGTAVGSGLLTSLSAVFEDMQLDIALPEVQGGMMFGGGQRGSREPQPDPPTSRVPDRVEPGSYESAVIVLLTDGQTTQGPDPLAAAQVAADLGVRVYTVGLGTEEGAILRFFGRSMRVQLDERTLEEIADVTEGEYFRAGSESDLRDVYRSLSSQLVLAREQTEITAIVAGIAALFLLSAVVLSMLWFSRIA
ncbi:MAG: VWA domain-containing protein [Spirochaetales bacterium]